MPSLMFWIVSFAVLILMFLDQILTVRGLLKHGLKFRKTQHDVMVKYGRFLILGKIGMFFLIFFLGYFLEARHFDWFMTFEMLVVLAYIIYDIKTLS